MPMSPACLITQLKGQNEARQNLQAKIFLCTRVMWSEVQRMSNSFYGARHTLHTKSPVSLHSAHNNFLCMSEHSVIWGPASRVNLLFYGAHHNLLAWDLCLHVGAPESLQIWGPRATLHHPITWTVYATATGLMINGCTSFYACLLHLG